LDLRRRIDSPRLLRIGLGAEVTATREGRQVRYELADDRLAGALRELARIVLDRPACPAHPEARP
jgi:hypothetical protein